MKELYSHLPNKTGVYVLKDENDIPLYIGKALALKERVKSYFVHTWEFSSKIRRLVRQAKKIDYILTESEFEALLLEARLIKKYQPKYNVRLKDDKRYPSIAISINEDFPRVYYTRRREETKEEGKILFFGPFPNPATVKRVLWFLREIFPFRSCRRMPKNPCLYYHLNLCSGVCFRPHQLHQRYKKSIHQLIKLLKGKKKPLISQLKSVMKRAADSGNFELAAKIKKQIEAIEYITRQRVKFEFLSDFEPMRYQREKTKLENLLKIKKVKRIEGYDISNIGGKWATGSMVVFVEGGPMKSEYRRFRIKSTDSPDDPGMLKEVLVRRLKHSEWQYPDLIVVDGGMGQVSAAIQALRLFELDLLVIGLAKKEEEIIFPKDGNEFKKIKLPKTSPALHLLQRIRDEAHRFAQSYHKKLRLSGFLS